MTDGRLEHGQLVMIERGSRQDRLVLAGRHDLTPRVQFALASVAELDVARHLAANYSLDVQSLARLADRFEELRACVALNPNAPVDVIESVPIGDHSPLSIERYLEARGASRSQREALWHVYESAPHPGGELLADVWARLA
ncbi:MAG: hypothetical protein J7503_14455 [Cellulomonas iranensis]|uniref:hypothetical protein n=1 Tax=Cellulomonas iranensis TaxID=76862 RepID=UPI001B221A44|nr:hypothetical protein [Cellulomonas iranensis]MBO9570006.1 hypothetical protein [Cellulomonas iranensis]